jgi:hypothetical protein
MADNILELIQICVSSGEKDDARNMLTGVLRADPGNVPAWELMAKLSDDPLKQADCYRQILHIDPNHSLAKEKLEALSAERAHLIPPEVQQVLNLLRELGVAALDKGTLEHFKAIGVDIAIIDDYVTISSRSGEAKVHINALPSGQHHLYPDEIIRRAGEPLIPAERMECPNCQATIPLSSTRCPWCSVRIH